MKIAFGSLGLAAVPQKTAAAEAMENTRLEPGLPRPSAGALRLAAQLSAQIAPEHPSQVLLFAPTAAASASRVLFETGVALVDLNRAPVLLVSLRQTNEELRSHCAASMRLGKLFDHRPWIIEGVAAFALARLEDPKADLLRAMSLDFPALLQAARKRFTCILLDCDPVDQNVAGLLAATHSHGVVLAVPAGTATVAEVQQAQAAFARTNAKVLGFVLDENR
ncbi:MAG: hypothetical protein ACRD7E_31810 [Bryobacteraceae bacterium]